MINLVFLILSYNKKTIFYCDLRRPRLNVVHITPGIMKQHTGKSIQVTGETDLSAKSYMTVKTKNLFDEILLSLYTCITMCHFCVVHSFVSFYHNINYIYKACQSNAVKCI